MKKFIITKDEPTANQLVANGFQLVSQTNDVYVFVNVVPSHFNFSAIDKSKLAYSNILCL